jgi:hypothetical protein
VGFNNHQEQNKECEEDMGLNQVIFCLSPDIQNLVLVSETEAGDTDLTIHEEVSSALDEDLVEIFKQTEV